MQILAARQTEDKPIGLYSVYTGMDKVSESAHIS